MLIEIEETRQIVTDPGIAYKLYERFLGRQKSQTGIIRNDDLDLVPVEEES